MSVLALTTLTGCLDGGNIDEGHDGYLGNEETEYVRPAPEIEDPADALSDALSEGNALIPETMAPNNGWVTDPANGTADNGPGAAVTDRSGDAPFDSAAGTPSEGADAENGLNEFGGSAINGNTAGH